MTASRPPDLRISRQPGDGWVECGCGRKHWGLHGAAGLLVWRESPTGVQITMQHRAHWTHHGNTWGVPGGALTDDETAVDGALREAIEEAGLVPASVRVRAERVLQHPDWSYTTVLAEAVADWEPTITDPESHELRWIDLADLDDYPLLTAFAEALPELRTMLRRLVIVVDAANVVGSVPDGWWRDRYAATISLRDHLRVLAHTGLPAEALDLPGGTWYPDIIVITEGEARDVPAIDGVTMVSAPTSGDDAIVETVAQHSQVADTVLRVATADRELIERVAELGAAAISPHLVRH